MILRFTVENHLTFRDEVVLSFVSTARRDEPAHRFALGGVRHGVLPVLGVWGANAAGKSNLLGALVVLRSLVADSFARFRPDDPLPWTPWRMRTEEGAPPTRMSLDFTVPHPEDGRPVRHHLALAWNARRIVEERLYAWPRGTRRLLYDRDADAPDDPWTFGPSLRRPRSIARATRPNSLFLSAAAQLDHEQLTPVWRAIASGIVVPPPAVGRPNLFPPGAALLAEERRGAVLEFLRAADLDIVGLEVEPRPELWDRIMDLAPRMVREEMRETVASEITALRAKGSFQEVTLLHGRGPDDAWPCPPGLESMGTWMLLWRLNSLIEVFERGGLWVVDEFDLSLHPELSGELVDLFTNPDVNTGGAQLLFATHDRELFERLRTDEVVIVHKDADGVSSVHTAADFRGVRTRDDLRRAHRQGRIGGVPLLLGTGVLALGAALLLRGAADGEE